METPGLLAEVGRLLSEHGDPLTLILIAAVLTFAVNVILGLVNASRGYINRADLRIEIHDMESRLDKKLKHTMSLDESGAMLERLRTVEEEMDSIRAMREAQVEMRMRIEEINRLVLDLRDAVAKIRDTAR